MIEINLLPEELRKKARKKDLPAINLKQVFSLVYLVIGLVLAIHLFLAGILIFKGINLNRLNNYWKQQELERAAVEAFKKQFQVLTDEGEFVQKLTSARVNWAQKLNSLSLNLAPGVWFNELSLNKNLILLRGSAISLSKEELALINRFIDNLNKDVSFSDDFSNIELGQVQRKGIAGYDVIDFTISAALK